MRALVITAMAGALLPAAVLGAFAQPDTVMQGSTNAREESMVEFLPIVSYDTDAGLGYGVKFFFLGYLKRNESFDFLLFNSTKGERLYRLVFSLPDFEIRQGTTYPLALDLLIDYDKWVAYSFFGIGNRSSFEDKETYTRNFNFSESSRLVALEPDLNSSRATSVALFSSVRYDTRDSYINPASGLVLQGDVEFASRAGPGNVEFTRLGAWIQKYYMLFVPKTILAVRFGLQGLFGRDIPVQFLLPIGGNNTLRGYTQDRFLDKVSAVGNIELRVPIYWRFGGVVGFDAGKVWHELSEVDLGRWATNPVAGLRFYMQTFVVRADLGFGKETTGFYLNFGHVF
jgi:outer membrane protein assembly factor BamA